jgi:predicted RNA-binding Zn ribbon-like protein
VSGDLIDPEDGGAPALHEPLGVEFANTIYALRRGPHDGLRTRGHAAAWLLERGEQFQPTLGAREVAGLTQQDLHLLIRLRDTIRAALQALVDGHDTSATTRDQLNAVSALSPQWLILTGDPPGTALATTADPVTAAAAAVARSAVTILGGPLRDAVRACPAPGCVLFFVKDHPRREWCSAACGNRVRVARHHARHR